MNLTPRHDPNTDIDNLLNVLRDTQPSPAMQARILANVTNRAAQPIGSSLRTWLLPLLASATAALIFIALHHTQSGTTHHPTAISTPPALPLTTNPGLPFVTAASPHASSPTKGTQNPGAPFVMAPSSQVGSHNLSVTDPLTQLALDETNAPSLPTPRVPLTGQERRMIHILHRGDAVQLAELDPRARAAALDDDLTQFQRFFPPPRRSPPPDSQ